MPSQLELRAARHAALGDPVRLAVVDELTVSDVAPHELAARLDMPSNLLAHHLDVLERAALIVRVRSNGDGRRRYVQLQRNALAGLSPGRPIAPGPMLFVCSRNSARSPLAAALWEELTNRPASSGGTHPAERVHPGAVAAARRHGIDLEGARPRAFRVPKRTRVQVVTVCDQAHEDLAPDVERGWWHWSVDDPVEDGSSGAFDDAVAELKARIGALVGGEQRSRA